MAAVGRHSSLTAYTVSANSKRQLNSFASIDQVPAIDAAIPEEEEPKFFGKICRDKVTGYKGMCIGRYWTYYAEKEYCLQARYNKKRSTKPSAIWIDEGRIEVLESKHAVEPEEVRTEHHGGVIDVPIPGQYWTESDSLNYGF